MVLKRRQRAVTAPNPSLKPTVAAKGAYKSAVPRSFVGADVGTHASAAVASDDSDTEPETPSESDGEEKGKTVTRGKGKTVAREPNAVASSSRVQLSPARAGNVSYAKVRPMVSQEIPLPSQKSVVRQRYSSNTPSSSRASKVRP